MSQVPQLRRCRGEAIVAGTCAAVARRYQIDPILVRVAAILLTLSAGVGLVLYFLGTLVIPREEQSRAPLERWVPGSTRWPRWVWVAIIVIACLTTARMIGPLVPFGILPAAVLLAVGYFGSRRPRQRRHGAAQQSRISTPARPYPAPGSFQREPLPPGPFNPRPAPAPPPAVPHPSLGPTAGSDNPYVIAASAVAPQMPSGQRIHRKVAPHRRSPGQRLRWVSLVLAVLALLLLAILQASGRQIPVPVWFAIPTAVLSGALIIGAFTHRPRGLGWMTAVLAIATLIAGAAERPPSVPHSTVTHTSTTPAPASRELNLGTLEIDLSQLQGTDPQTYTFGVDAGTLILWLPDQGNVILSYTIGAGSIDGPGLAGSGLELVGERSFVTDPDAALTRIELRTDVGSIEVRE